MIPAALAAWRQFIVWRLVPGVVKPIKQPCNWRNGHTANAHDPSNWLSADEAAAAAQQLGPGFGVGFVFTEADPFYFVDIDGALQADGQWSPVAQQLCQVFAGAFVEVSQSGQGLHIVVSGPLPDHGCKNKAFHLELYHADRFMALGSGGRGDAAWRSDEAAQWVVQSYFTKGATGVELDDLTTAPVPEWNGPTDDDELIRRAMNSRGMASMFGTKASFADLFTNNVPVLAKAYPKADGTVDGSSADMALLSHFGFWTGKHGERMLRLMLRSELRRPKWEKHRNYLRMSCIESLQMPGAVLQDKLPEPVDKAHPVGPAGVPQQREVEGSTFMTPAQQVALFAGCVYVYDAHGVLVQGGEVLDPARFKVMFGGYTFTMDTRNERTVRNAFEAFTESQVLRPPRAETTCFRPDLPAATIVTASGRRAVNTWWPIEVPSVEGNPGPFLRHLAKLLPNERDAGLLLAYMAACVQHKGIKFQWAPLLQGVEGNGKTFFSHCVMNAVGMRYCHMPRPMDISSKFNPWLKGKLVIAIEDVYSEVERTEIFEILKPMITGRLQPVEPKGVDQVMAEICCNFIFNSNHKDGVRKTPNDRRIAPLFTAQQDKRHLARDGMGKDYFASLWAWYEHGGMAVVNHFLATYPIPDDLNPAMGGIAPETSSTAEAIEQSLGTVEQQVQEAIAQNRVGFMDGWASSIYLDALLEEKGLSRRVPLNRRREMMRALGYDYHPALTDGRVNNTVLPDAAKPRLYVRAGHAALALTTPADVARAYTTAQMPAGFGVRA